MKSYYKSAKARLSFFLHKNPRIEDSRRDFRKFVPEPYQGVAIVSADFELAWAWRFDKRRANAIADSLELARTERRNIPALIQLCERYEIPISWGTVGHLFLDSCSSNEGHPHPEISRLPYFENEWWKYDKGDWFDADPCSDLTTAPEWYAPDLVQSILNSKIRHEIACHSFSHISCEDSTCSPETLNNELIASQKAASQKGIQLESFIFPGHTMGNYDTLRSCGYTSMRTNFINVLGYPEKHNNGIWEHKTTMELGYNPLFSVSHNIYRYRYILDKCIRNRQVCNLWFHPSFDDISLQQIVPEVFRILHAHKDKIWITTMKDYTQWLNHQ